MDTNKILSRVRAIKGQLELVISMVENKKDYFAVMQQSKAVNGGLKKLNCRILQYHLKNHMFKGTSTEVQKKDLKQLMDVFKKYQSCKS
jgi:DNA-binding FrmR family transcriptional regulator